MNIVNLDKQYYHGCSLSSEAHVENSLGKPIELPEAISQSLETEDAEANLLQLFKLMKGCDYECVIRDNTYNNETDLDQFFIYSVYAPVGSSDWVWQRDCFVLIEMGYPGDPRYVSYRTANVYDLGDDQLADTGFFDWTLGWYACYLSDGQVIHEGDLFIENLREKLSAGYSSNPTYELSQMCESEPAWDEQFEGYVAKVKGSEETLVFFPAEPIYG